MASMNAQEFNVDRLAELARITLTPEEVELFGQQLPQILDYVAHLDAVDTQDLEETAQVTGLMNVFREDYILVDDSAQLREQSSDLFTMVHETEANMVKVPLILVEE